MDVKEVKKRLEDLGVEYNCTTEELIAAVASAQALIPLDKKEIEKIKYAVKLSDLDVNDVNLWWYVRDRYDVAFNEILNKFATKAPELPTKKEIHNTVQKVILDFQVNEVSLSGKYLKDDPKCLVDMLTDAICSQFGAEGRGKGLDDDILDWHKKNKKKIEHFIISTPYGDYTEAEKLLVAIFKRIGVAEQTTDPKEP